MRVNWYGAALYFDPAEGAVPRGPYKVGLEEAKALLSRHDPEELHEPSLSQEYFAKLFADIDEDAHGIQKLRLEMNYPEVATLSSHRG